MEWIFDGIGTAIITLIVGLLTGGDRNLNSVQKQFTLHYG